MKNEFKIKDKVFSYNLQQWGTIIKEEEEYKSTYPITVEFKNGHRETYTIDGKELEEYVAQDLFFDEVAPVVAPCRPRPKLEVDTKVLVWNTFTRYKRKRYFSHFDGERIHCFTRGATSFSNIDGTMSWNNWELYEEEKGVLND